MDDSFYAAASGNKFPAGDPDEDWTIEELIRWSLDRHQSSAVERTAAAIASLMDQCEKECEDVMTLHAMAVEIEDGGERRVGRDDGAVGRSGKEGGGVGVVDEENVDPQRMSLDDGPAIGSIATSKATTGSTTAADAEDVAAESSTARGDTASSALMPPSSSSSSPQASSTAIDVQITVGPHAPSRFHLRPRPGAPCLVGRSKGKKFVKNGISLHRDQEVSTTHGKFVVVEDGVVGSSGGAKGGEGRSRPRYYFVDVGSTNGTVCDSAPLKPNVRLPLVNGMELKVGNSMLRIILNQG
ncbi:hypothetical protein ACHAW5_008636 [Stephanodiscus triporus]|uniref:FHA domain-containing protein n=1 Tax=Stephanodiscus triporus TaxID=2934178 RepID=A0ABD3N4J8_9STRA